MDPILLLVGAGTGATAALLIFHVYRRATLHRRLIVARIRGETGDLISVPANVLRRERRRLPLVRLLPLSPEARERMRDELFRAGWAISVNEYLALRLACGVGGCVMALFLIARLGIDAPALKALVIAGLAFGGWLIGGVALVRARQQRLQRIEEQLPDALTSIAKSLRVGAGVLQALAYAADETPAPLGAELQTTLRDLQLGAETPDAFGDLAKRVGSADLSLAVTAIVIQRAVGGNLSEILMHVTETVRERSKLHREVRVLTTRQRVTSNMVAAVPVAIAVFLMTSNSKMFSALTDTTPGQIALAFGITSELFGIWLIRRLATIEV